MKLPVQVIVILSREYRFWEDIDELQCIQVHDDLSLAQQLLLVLNGVALERVKVFRYLGIWLSEELVQSR